MNPTQTMTAPSGYKAVQKYTPQQMQLFQGLFSNVSPDSFTARLAGGDQSAFDQAEAPALRQFNQLQGQNASRFSGAGMGARRGSGFQNAQNQATSDFAQDLASRRQEMQRQAIQDLMGFSNQILGQKPYENYLEEEEEPWWKALLSEGLPIAAGAAGQFFGVPAPATYAATKGLQGATDRQSNPGASWRSF